MQPYDSYDLGAINDQLRRCRELGFYRERVEPVDSWAGFRELPLLTREELFADIEDEATGPFGSLYREETALTALTPAGESDLLLEFATGEDVDAVGRRLGGILREAGLSAGDVVVSCFAYTPFAGGYLFHAGLREVGANVVPVGPGEAGRTAGLIGKYDVDVLLSPPSFAMEIADQGGTDVGTVVCSGEPFTVIPGYRERLKAAFDGARTVDYYALSEVGPVASEDGTEGEMYVAEDHILLEVLDPETGEPVDPGEQGEAVVTHLDKQAQPLVRYRTGDLTALGTADGRLTLPRGVFGRTDSMLKVKGVKVYPGQLGLVFYGTPGLTGTYRVVVDRPENTDRLTIECEAEDPEAVDRESLRGTIREALLVTPDELDLVAGIDGEGMQLEDRRFD
jgi:phenylacetate-CoA ligase